MAIFTRPGPRLAFLIGAAAFLIGGDAAFAAQNASPPAAGATDQVFQAQKAAYEALSEADRRAVQDALIWTGDYNGVVDGNFGKRTCDAILAYQANIKAPTTGILDPAALARLIAAAGKAKAAVRFQIVADEKSGVRIGAPLKLIDRRVALPNGLRLANAEGSATLDLASADGDLAALYARLSADAPGRKTTLKLSRPDFFVLSGEEGGRKFYMRYAKAPANWPDPNQVRGFKLIYPAQSSSFDRIAIAIADTFEPFSTAPMPAAVVAPASPAKPALAASGLVVAAGQALTALDSAACPHPSVDGKPAKYLREDKQAGLSLIGAGFAASPPAPLAVARLSDDLVALTYAADASGAKPALQVAAVAPLAGAADAAQPLLVASLPQNAAGSPVFDRSGALVAIVARAAAETKPVAGVVPLAPHPVIAASQIEPFLTAADIAFAKPAEAGASAAGRIAAEKGGLIVPIVCE